jgi:hypothetical protein
MKVSKLISVLLVVLLTTVFGIGCESDDGGGTGTDSPGAFEDWAGISGFNNDADDPTLEEATEDDKEVMKVTWSIEAGSEDPSDTFAVTRLVAEFPEPEEGDYSGYDGLVLDFKTVEGNFNLVMLLTDGTIAPWKYEPGWINTVSGDPAWQTIQYPFASFEQASWGGEEYDGTIQEWFADGNTMTIELQLGGTDRTDDTIYFSNIGFYKGATKDIIWFKN